MPSLPSYLSQRGHRCFLVDVIWSTMIVRTKVKKLGKMTKRAKPRSIEINSGFKITSVLIFWRQKGHLICMGLLLKRIFTCPWTKWRVITLVVIGMTTCHYHYQSQVRIWHLNECFIFYCYEKGWVLILFALIYYWIYIFFYNYSQSKLN